MNLDNLRSGAIVFANSVPDFYGRNLKDRRVVIVTPDHELPLLSVVTAVAITGEIESVPDGLAVPLRWRPGGHPKTGLTKKCVAACHWIVRLPVSALDNVTGHCSTLEMDEIMIRIADHLL